MRAVRRFVAIAAIAAGLGVAAQAQSGRPMTIHDLLVAIRVTDPQLSPDGRSVAFVRTTTDLASGKRNGDIWLVPADGSAAPRALLAGEKAENTPRWSPDGRQLAFISTRDGDPQVYLADAGGANIRQLTAISGGAQPPLVWSPDGSTLAFVSDVYPDCPDDACNKARRDAADKDPVKVRVLTRLLFRHWDEWREGIRHHVFVAPTAARRRRARSHAGRFRFTARAAGGRGDHLHRRQPVARVRVQPRRQRPRGLEHQQRRLARPGRWWDGRQDHAQPRGGRAARVHAQRAVVRRAGAAPARLRVRPVVSGRLRPRHQREAHGVRNAGPVGQRVHPGPRRPDDLLHGAL